MKRLVLLGEGHGEVSALPVLIAKKRGLAVRCILTATLFAAVPLGWSNGTSLKSNLTIRNGLHASLSLHEGETLEASWRFMTATPKCFLLVRRLRFAPP